MPRGSPFTALCQLTASLSRRVVADLHCHSTASDGDFTPSQVIALAHAARLDAVAITDHDTFAGDSEARQTLAQWPDAKLQVLQGVELTCEWNDREIHLLAYFHASPSQRLIDVCAELCVRRRERFHDYLRLLREAGFAIPEERVARLEARTASLGRRHVAGLVFEAGAAKTYREIWSSILGPITKQVMPKLRLPMAHAAELVHGSQGITSLAHPPADFNECELEAMKSVGLDAVEAIHPSAKHGRSVQLRQIATMLGLLCTGGSDCHGPGDATRLIGSRGANAEDVLRIRASLVKATL